MIKDKFSLSLSLKSDFFPSNLTLTCTMGFPFTKFYENSRKSFFFYFYSFPFNYDFLLSWHKKCKQIKKILFGDRLLIIGKNEEAGRKCENRFFKGEKKDEKEKKESEGSEAFFISLTFFFLFFLTRNIWKIFSIALGFEI